MKSVAVICVLLFVIIAGFSFIDYDSDEPVHIPPSKQRPGNANKGYEYLVTGDYIKSGLPLAFFKAAFGKDTTHSLGRTGLNKNLPYQYNAVIAPNGVAVVAPNCLQCHAQVFEGRVVVGMGNSFSDFTMDRSVQASMSERFIKANKTDGAKNYEAARAFLTSLKAISPGLVVPIRGVNAANHLAALLISHRDPQTLRWSDSALIKDVGLNIPTDVPAWWLLKKKNAMFYNGNGRGDFGRFLMASNLLTVTDTSEASEVDRRFNDVLAYILSIEPPKYPGNIDQKAATAGKKIFVRTCQKCHGSYGEKPDYPNLLIPASEIKTDPLLSEANYSNPEALKWFNKSWFATGDHPAKLVPFNGYIAPPLDGIWATAPYLHNGSVPSLSLVLNSKARPEFWERDFLKPVYNYADPGWKFEVVKAGGYSSIYNTTLPGYSNKGHEFGDNLTTEARNQLIEYLKTL